MYQKTYIFGSDIKNSDYYSDEKGYGLINPTFRVRQVLKDHSTVVDGICENPVRMNTLFQPPALKPEYIL